MAVTGAIFNKLIFGEIDSSDYGIYITGEAVFNAPKRAVTMVDVPGRNGALAIDQGHWENIEVTYPAGLFGSDKDDFRAAISEFRNALASQIGYQRLEDSYHPDEYRMGLFFDGIEVDPVHYNTAGEFTIKFNCKPQRWLTSGEVAVSVESGDTLTNPTQYESSPLLAVKGYGTVGFNGYEVSLDNSTSKTILLRSAQSHIVISDSSYTLSFIGNMLNDGDTITMESQYWETIAWTFKATSGGYIQRITVDSNSGITGSNAYSMGGSMYIALPNLTFEKGTSASYTNTTVVSGRRSDSSTFTAQFVLTVEYDGVNTISFSIEDTYSAADISRYNIYLAYGNIMGETTKPQLGDPTYIDCELGDAYAIVDGDYISLNDSVNFGSDLPTLAGGANEITYDSTITALSITPRWWRL